MFKKRFWLVMTLLVSACTLYAMGHKMKEIPDDTEFDAKAVGKAPDPHISDATKEQAPVGLPANPDAVEKDTAKGFSDPFFTRTEKDPDLENNQEKK